MDAYERIRRLRDEYEAALDEAERFRDAYHREVVKLHRSGVSLREIAENLGISHQRVHQIVSPAEAGRPGRRGRVSGAAAGMGMLVLAATTFVLGRATSPPQAVERAEPLPTPTPTVWVVTRCPFREEPSTLTLAAAAGVCQRRLGRTAQRSSEPGTGMVIDPETGTLLRVFSQSRRFTRSLPVLNPEVIGSPPS